MQIYVHKTSPKAVTPTCAYNGTSAAFDITCTETTVIPAHGCAVVPNGLNLTIDHRQLYYMIVHLRSSTGFKKDLICHPGVIDAGYTGDLGIKIYNLGDEDVVIKEGDRYAQLTVHRKLDVEFTEMDDQLWQEFKSEQTRGDSGFGSSGQKVE